MRRCLGVLFRRSLWLVLLGGSLSLRAPAQEWRGLWVDAFHDGFKTSQQVSQLVANVRGANCNAIAVEVRKRGDAYYKSQYEPQATDIASDFDPLQDLLIKAHDTNAGPRIEVHAWMVTFPVWGDQVNPPAASNHVFNLHPDWLTQDSTNNRWAGSFYVLDPAHPGVQDHLYKVAMDIVTNYAVDGLNFDYIRYPDNNASNGNNPWGYNPVSVARFNRLFSRNGPPGATDPLWIQFRRDQVTALVRKVYLSAVAARPAVKISADTITWYPGVTTDQEWLSSAGAYNRVLQDWRAWMEEGILDLNLPMNYFRQNTSYASDYAKWSQFTKDHRYSRQAAIGPGLYLNSLSNGLYQMRLTREVTLAGNRADGVCGYSYAVPASNTIANLQATFLSALTQPSIYDPVTPSLFAAPAPVPVMPWKTAPSRGHLKGFVLDATSTSGCDGATVTLSGPENRTLLSDVSGFYGAVDLPPGNYSLVASMAGFRSMATNFTIVAGVVTTRDLPLAVVLPSNNLTVTPGARAAIISWTTPIPATTQVEYSSGTNHSSLTPLDPQPRLQHAVFLAGLEPDTSYCVQAISLSGPDEYRSSNACFTTAGTIILDNVGGGFAWGRDQCRHIHSRHCHPG
ncbi:MAG: family 10 glycosylhydrolase [Verrucomicrobia bacterium]|nr:family 10 glycosylhydrolase [Verrucomicrobiota bacterium]